MGQFTAECREILKEVTERCNSEWIALSGGLDSSILAHLLKEKKLNAVTIITKDFLGTDLTYSQIVAKHTDLPLSLLHIEMKELLDSIDETIKILKNFNDIEIRNSIVPYMYLNSLKNKGINSIITGDGADEIFAGYNFLLKKPEEELEDELKRIKEIMHFPSRDIAEVLGMKIEPPFLDQKVMEYSDKLPISEKWAKECISLPVYPYMKLQDAQKVVKTIKRFFNY